MLSILCVRLTIKVKVGIPESFKVGWYPPKKLGRVTLSSLVFGATATSTGRDVMICAKLRMLLLTTLPSYLTVVLPSAT